MAQQVRRVLPALREARRARSACSTKRCCSTTWRSSARRLKPERDLQFGYLGLQTLYDRYFLDRPVRGARQCRPPLRAAAMLLHARRDGARAERGRPRGARDRVLQRAVDVRLHVEHAHAVQLRHASLATVVVLPDDGVRRPRRHLRSDQGERAAVQVRGRAGQRLDERARDGLAHQGHERQVAGRRAVPQGRERHGGRGEPGRQAQGRRLHLPRDLAPRHRGVPRAAQEHRRRPPPHARHEHGELDSRPVHEAGDRRRRLDAVLARPTCRTCTTSGARSSRRPTPRYEAKAARGELKLHKKIPAVQLWRKMLSMLFETGHPWITFKDACNVRSPQSHVGTVHSSNLCTEITLNTSETEIAVCNLGSVNLLAHMVQGRRPGLGRSITPKLQRTIRTAMRMLDNVIDINYYAVEEGARQQPAASSGRPGHHGLPGRAASAAPAVRVGRRDGVRRHVDGSGLLLRVLGVDRARRGARQVQLVQGQPVGPRHPAAGLAEAVARRARRLRRGRRVVDDGLGRAARAHQAARHAQLELRGDRADGDDLQHHRRVGIDRARVPEHLRQVEPVRRVHRRQRAAGAAT